MSKSLVLLRRVGVASTALSFALVAWGAIVRINGAGMTCPDWPRCRGVWFPALDPKVVYEFSHRVGAAALTVIVLATFLSAWAARSSAPSAFRASWVSLGLIVAQIAAGALTIFLQNDAPSVAIHLVLGFATFASLLMVTMLAYAAPVPTASVRASAPHGGDASSLRLLALASAVLAFVAVFAAGWMAASNDGLACTGLPLCGAAGALTADQQIHMGHRLAAYATIAAVVALWVAARSARAWNGRAFVAASVALALTVLQGMLGAAAVMTRLAPLVRSWHEANGALLIGALVVTAYFASFPAPAPEPR